MAANSFVDPVIVATPVGAADRDGIVEWLENLGIWLKEALSAHFTWLHSRTITELLDAQGLFPNFENLRNLQRKYRLDINSNLLARNVNEFFRNPEFDLEGKLDHLGYLAELDHNSVTISPKFIPDRWPDFIHSKMYSLLVTSCVCKHTAHPFADALRIATLKFPDQNQEITISATITYVIPELACQPGDIITQTFPLLFTPEGLQPLINVLELFVKGEDRILYVLDQQWKKDWQKSGGIRMPFRLGSHFIESIIEAGLDTNEIVLKRVVMLATAVIAGQAKNIESAKLHPLRTNLAGNSPQRVREKDQASAWRLDITKHGAGWRLHYWHIPGQDGGIIEFSNVCKESDVTIYE